MNVTEEMIEDFAMHFWPVNYVSKLEANRDGLRAILTAAISAGEAVQPVAVGWRCSASGKMRREILSWMVDPQPVYAHPSPASAGVVGDWQDIATAPISNGSNRFLAHITGHGSCVCYAGAGGFIYNVATGKRILRATHFMPLPASPATDGGKPSALTEKTDEQKLIADLSSLVKKMLRDHRKGGLKYETTSGAEDFLSRKGLWGSPLRDVREKP